MSRQIHRIRGPLALVTVLVFLATASALAFRGSLGGGKQSAAIAVLKTIAPQLAQSIGPVEDSNSVALGDGMRVVTTGSLAVRRGAASATALADGRVLVVGGRNNDGDLGSAEIYDPQTRRWSLLPSSLSVARSGHSAVLLNDGRVLIAGGYSNGRFVQQAEVFDPAGGQFSIADSLTAVRSGMTATLLTSGKVVIAGGDEAGSAEIFDPATLTFSALSSKMVLARGGATATRLRDGRVLIAGGSFQGEAVNSAEIFDPSTGAFAATSFNMASARSGHSAVLLGNGAVAVIGGDQAGSVEIFDPASQSFSVQAVSGQRMAAASPLVAGRKSVVALGSNSIGVIDLATGAIEPAARDARLLYGQAAMANLFDGGVVIAGGFDNTGSAVTSSSRIYGPPQVTANITQIVVTSGGGQAITAGSVSAAVVVQARNVGGTAEAVDTANATITMTSTSSTMTFASNAAGPFSAGPFTVTYVNGNSNAQFFYKDNTAGTPTITITPANMGTAAAITTGSTISPAGIDHFDFAVATPQRNRIAFTGTNTLTAKDQFNNTITTFDASANNVTVTATGGLSGTVSGLGAADNNVLNQPGSFPSGVANLTTEGMTFTGTAGTGTFTAATTTGVTGKTGVSGSVTINGGNATGLAITGAATQTTGIGQNLTITARDPENNTDATFVGDKVLTFSGANSSPNPVVAPTVTDKGGAEVNFGNATTITFTSGVSTVPALGVSNGRMKLFKAEVAIIGATTGTISTGTSGGATLTVTVTGVLDHFVWATASPQTNGSAFTGANTLTATDAFGNTVTGFDASANNVTVTASLGGTVTGLGSAGNNVLNQTTNFASGVANLTALGMKYTGTSGSTTFTATSANSKTGTSGSVTINPGAATQFKVTGSTTQVAGTTNSITVTALDGSGNTATSFTGDHTIVFSGASSTSVSNPTVTDKNGTAQIFGQNTVMTFASGAATGSMVLVKAETANIVATEPSSTFTTTGTNRLTVTVTAAGTVARLGFSVTPGAFTAGGISGTITVQTQDASGNETPVTGGTLVVSLTTSHTTTGSFRDTADTTTITSVNIQVGNSTASFKYKDTNANTTATITASATGLTSGTFVQTINPAAASKLTITSPAKTTQAGFESTDITVQVQDQFGNNRTNASGVTLTILLSTSSSTGSFRSSDGLGTVISSVTIPNGVGTATFRYRDTVAGSATVTATDSSGSLSAASQTETTTNANASKLVFTTAQQTTTVNVSTGIITVQSQDAFGNVAPIVGGNLNITLTSNSTGTFSFRNSADTAVITSVTIEANVGASTASFRYRDSKVNTSTTAPTKVKVTTNFGSGDVNTEQPVVINPAAADRITLSTPATGSPFAAGSASDTITVTSRDAGGNVAAVVGSNLIVNLTKPAGNTTGSFVSAADGTTVITSVTIPVGSSTATFKYKDTKVPNAPGVSTVTITATGVGLTTAAPTLGIDFIPAAATVLTLSRTSLTITNGDPNQPFTVTTKDAFGNTSNVAVTTVTVLLSSTSSTGKFFASGTGTQITSVSIGAGANQAAFDYNDTTLGSSTLTVSASSFTSASIPVTVNGNKLVLTGAIPGTASNTPASITVQIQNAAGTPQNATVADVVVSLSTNSSGGTFFASGGTTTVITSVTIPIGSNSATFNYRETRAASNTITASNPSLTSATLTGTTFAAAVSKLAITSAAKTTVAGVSTSAITVQRQDAFGNATTAGALTVNLTTSATTTGQFRDSATDTTVITSVTIADLASTATFVYRDTKAGTPTITAAATDLTSGTQTVTVTQGGANKLAFTTAAQTILAGANSATITVQVQDVFGNPVTVTSGSLPVSLSTTSATGIFLNSAGTATITTVQISGGSSGSFLYRDTTAGTPTITVSAPLLTSATQTETITPDTAIPVVTITSPAAGATVASKTVTVTGTATSTGSPIGSVTVNGSAATLDTAMNTFTGTATATSDGSFTITVVATTNAGNSATATRTVTIDSTGPVVAITSPAAGAFIKTTSLTVTGTVSDATSSVSSVTVNGTAATITAGTFTATLTGLANGSLTLTVVATDSAGNSTTATRTVTVDTVAPVVTINSPAAGATLTSTSIAVSTTVTDTGGSGVASVSINGVAATAAGGGVWNATVTAPGAGAFTISVTATDNAGNTSAAVTRSVTVVLLSVTSVSFGNKTLTITGTGFAAGAVVKIDGVATARPVTVASATTITVSGSKKKIGVKGGTHTVQVTVGANSSNTLTFTGF